MVGVICMGKQITSSPSGFIASCLLRPVDEVWNLLYYSLALKLIRKFTLVARSPDL